LENASSPIIKRLDLSSVHLDLSPIAAILETYPTFLPDTCPTYPTQAIDLEPIDFEHFLDEPDLERSHHLEKMFRVTYGEGPARGR